MKKLDKFFEELLADLEDVRVKHKFHPPLSVLKRYVNGRLKDEWTKDFERFVRGDLDDWKLSEVSLHVLTCKRCEVIVERLRAKALRPQLQLKATITNWITTILSNKRLCWQLGITASIIIAAIFILMKLLGDEPSPVVIPPPQASPLGSAPFSGE
jgi:hypothetical protein